MTVLLHVGALLIGVLLSVSWWRAIVKGAPRGKLFSGAWVAAMVIWFIAAFALFDFALSR